MSEQVGVSLTPVTASETVAETVWETEPHRPWQRAWATVYDISAFSIAGMAVLTVLIGIFSPATAHALNTLPYDNTGRYVWLFMAGLVAVPPMAFFLSEFGATPGKWVLGVRLERKDGGPLDFPLMLKRELMMLFLGYGANLGPSILFAAYLSDKALSKKGEARWDAACGTRILYRERSTNRIIIGLCALLCLLVLIAAIPD